MDDYKQIQKRLDDLANKIVPDLQLNFVVSSKQWDAWVAIISITETTSIDRLEILRNDDQGLENILKIRLKNALLNLKDSIQKQLEKIK